MTVVDKEQHYFDPKSSSLFSKFYTFQKVIHLKLKYKSCYYMLNDTTITTMSGFQSLAPLLEFK